MRGQQAGGPVALHCHAGTAGSSGRALTVSVARPEPGILALRFDLAADLQWLAIPPAATPGFVSGLWRHTCFEAFIATDPAAGYLEYNLSPSGEWATFAFTGYRAGMRPLAVARRPIITWAVQPACASLSAVIDVAGLPTSDPGADWRVGLAAVIENLGGGLSYWALAHPAEKPDFHHPDAFALTVTAPQR
jgi:hypothetical protein